MRPAKPLVQQIQQRVIELQKSYVLLQEKQARETKEGALQLERSALKLIDILDMIEMLAPEMHDATGVRIMQKIQRRLLELLRTWQVQEITLTLKDEVQPGKVRVLETRVASGKNSGTILEICRKGYQRGDKVIRPADIITAE